jgi:hypothetical protein
MRMRSSVKWKGLVTKSLAPASRTSGKVSRSAVLGLESPARLDAVNPGHLHVQDNDLGSHLFRQVRSFLAMGGNNHLVSRLSKEGPQEFADVFLVVHAQDRVRHGAPSFLAVRVDKGERSES